MKKLIAVSLLLFGCASPNTPQPQSVTSNIYVGHGTRFFRHNITGSATLSFKFTDEDTVLIGICKETDIVGSGVIGYGLQPDTIRFYWDSMQIAYGNKVPGNLIFLYAYKNIVNWGDSLYLESFPLSEGLQATLVKQ